jgi:hypothetical protein
MSVRTYVYELDVFLSIMLRNYIEEINSMKRRDLVTMTFQLPRAIYNLVKKDSKKRDESMGCVIRVALATFYHMMKENNKYDKQVVSEKRNAENKEKRGNTNGRKKAKVCSKSSIQKERVGGTE